MAMCPKCGRQVTDNLLIPQSEIRGWEKTVSCTCGYVIRYRMAGYNEHVRKLEEEEIKRKEMEVQRNTIIEKHGKGYSAFLTFFYICTFASYLYFAVVFIMNSHIGESLIILPSALFLTSFPLYPVGITASYPRNSDSSLIIRRRIIAIFWRIIGILLGIVFIASFIIGGMNGGRF